MTAPLYLGSGWKMNMTAAETRVYLRELRRYADVLAGRHYLFVVPPFTSLWAAKEELAGSPIHLGAQNMHWEKEGSFTGEISPGMMAEIGIDLVELGHSERRRFFGETDETINRKVLAALPFGWRVLLCVGETAWDKECGLADEALTMQLRRAFRGVTQEQAGWIMIAYEPVWAIGEQGTPATPQYISSRHCHIKRVLRDLWRRAGDGVPILYGGSVNKTNAAEIIVQPQVDGLFIGRASWDAKAYCRLLEDLVNVTGLAG